MIAVLLLFIAVVCTLGKTRLPLGFFFKACSGGIKKTNLRLSCRIFRLLWLKHYANFPHVLNFSSFNITPLGPLVIVCLKYNFNIIIQSKGLPDFPLNIVSFYDH